MADDIIPGVAPSVSPPPPPSPSPSPSPSPVTVPRSSTFSDDSGSEAAEPASRMLPRSRRGGNQNASANWLGQQQTHFAGGSAPDRPNSASLYHQEPAWPPPPIGSAADLFANGSTRRRVVRGDSGDLRGERANVRSRTGGDGSDGSRGGGGKDDSSNGKPMSDPFYAVEKASDDEEEDYDESEIVASSFLRRGTREYTKLETMSSDQIRRVIHFYHIFLLLSVLVTIALTIVENVLFRDRNPFPFEIPVTGLFSEELFRQGFREQASFQRAFVERISDSTSAGAGDVGLAVPPSVPSNATSTTTVPNGTADASLVVPPAAARLASISSFHYCNSVSVPAANLDDTLLTVFLADRGLYPCSASLYCDVCTGQMARVLDMFDTRRDFFTRHPNARPTYACASPAIPEPKPSSCQSVGGANLASRNAARPLRHMALKQVAKTREEACENYKKQEGKNDCNDDAGASAPSAGQPFPPSAGSSDEEWDRYATNLADFAISEGRGPDDPNPASVMQLTVFNSDRKYLVGIHSFNFAASAITSMLAAVFIFRIARLGRSRITHEQIWVAFLLVLAAVYWNAWDSLNRINLIQMSIERSKLLTNGASREEVEAVTGFLPSWYEGVRVVMEACREPAFSAIVFFYTWASLHTYRILDPTKHLSLVTFYLPKLAIIVPYVLFKTLAQPSLNLFLSEIPLASMLVWVRHYHQFRVWNALRSELLFASGAAVMELILVGIIIAEAFTTNSVLRRSKYMKYRTKQIGFRFFVYLNFTFYVTSAVLHLMVILAMPSGVLIIFLASDGVWLKEPTTWLTGPSLLLLGYAWTEAYVKLPRQAIGPVKGWFVDSKLAPSSSRWSRSTRDSVPVAYSAQNDDEGVNSRLLESSNNPSLGIASLDGSSLLDPNSDTEGSEASPSGSKKMPKFLVDHDSELNLEIAEPVRYQKRESSEHLELKANSFIMETHVMMFNFAWYVYYYGTPKAKKVRPTEESRFSVFAHIKSEETDTHALVIDSVDRIVISFKGTTSMRNMQTSIQIYHEHLHAVVPTDLRDGVDESDRLSRLYGRSYANAKVHKGFAVAYRSVGQQVMEAVQKLLAKKRRPVFLTGHSLGGALATLCSLDCWLKLKLSRREILVSTFGSPRVGNDAFREVYKSTVPLHWRIVVVPDLVTKLPKVGYKHVGKKVTLTTYGRMLIDPSMLDNLHWSSNSSAAFAHHRKASYLLAMRAWCARNHGSKFTPAFWAFPVSADDKRRFGVVPIQDTDRSKVPSRLIELDALVDALGGDDDEDSEVVVENGDHYVELWSRLARRALLNATLRS